jgi:hypothetical protein
MPSSPQEQIDIYKYHIKLYNCIAASIIMLATCVAALPIIFAILKIDAYGGYIIIATAVVYLICILVVSAKWYITVSECKMKINKKMETIRSPLYRV